MNKNHIGSDFDEFLLRELNDHLKALISVSMENKRDLEYIKYKLDTLEKKSEDVNLINIKDKRQKIKKLLISDAAPNYFRHRPDEILFVNFNYTLTEIHYDDSPTDNEFDKNVCDDTDNNPPIVSLPATDIIVFIKTDSPTLKSLFKYDESNNVQKLFIYLINKKL